MNYDPLPIDDYFKIASERERALQGIADNIGYWLKWVTKQHTDEGLPVDKDTHVMLDGYEGCPPSWPSVGQLNRWLYVLRDTPSQLIGDETKIDVPGEGDYFDRVMEAK